MKKTFVFRNYLFKIVRNYSGVDKLSGFSKNNRRQG